MGTSDLRDNVTKKLFDPSKVSIHRDAELSWFTDDEWIRLAGAPRGSRLTISLVERRRKAAVEVVVELRVSNPDYFLSDLVMILFQVEGTGKFALVLSAISIVPLQRVKKIGTRIFATIATEAAAQGFLFIDADAIGSPATMAATKPEERYNGQYSWARMGFDAAIPPYVVTHCTGALQGLTRVHQLMATPNGRNTWKQHALSLWLRFELAQNSVCWNTLNRYMQDNEIRVTP